MAEPTDRDRLWEALGIAIYFADNLQRIIDHKPVRDLAESRAAFERIARAAFDEARNGIHATPDQGSQPAHTNEDRCPDCRTPAGARHYCDKAPAFFIPEAKLASDDTEAKPDPIDVPCTGCGASAGEPCRLRAAWDPPTGRCDRQAAQAAFDEEGGR